METWFIFALMVAMLYPITNILDSKMRNNYIKDEFVLTTLGSFMSLLPLILVPILGFPIIPFNSMILAFIAGAMFIYACIPYFKALSIEDTSTVVTMFYLAPAAIPILTRFILNEQLLGFQYIGFFLIIAGGILISIKKNEFNKFHISSALFLMLASGFFFNLSYVFEKLVFETQPFWDGFIWIRLGNVLAVLTLIPTKRFRTGFTKVKNTINFKAMKVMFSAEMVSLLAMSANSFALSLGPASLVIGVTNLQPLFLLILIILLSKYFPKLYKEEMDKKVLTLKIIAIIIMVIGLYLIGS